MKDFYSFASDGSLVLKENSPVNPKSIYATSKIAADFLTMNYVDPYGIPGVTTRMFNNYGPRQNPRYVTGTVISQALSKDTIEIGQGGQVLTGGASGCHGLRPRQVRGCSSLGNG